MVCYCNRRKIIFIHIPKTGGLTIEDILIKKYSFKYFTFEKGRYEFLNNSKGTIGIFRYILLYSKESKKYDLKSFKKFAFVRNPYERAISAMKYLHKVSPFFPPNMKSFIIYSKINTYFYVHFNLSQSDCLRDDNGDINIDYIGKFENFQNDLEDILFNKLGLNRTNVRTIHKNKSNSSLNIESYNLFDEVTNIHSEDFEKFGYEIFRYHS